MGLDRGRQNLGPKQGMKGGIGTASVDLGGGVVVGAMVAVMPLGRWLGTVQVLLGRPPGTERPGAAPSG